MLGPRLTKLLGQRIFKCSSTGCGATYKKEWRLLEHVYQHTGQKPWKCTLPQCAAAYAKKRYLQRHQQLHLDVVKKHTCPTAECSAAFRTKRGLKRHLLYKHGDGDGPIKCSMEGCNRTFRKKRSLRVHLLEHSEPWSICDVNGCGKKLQSAAQLTGHRRRHRGYECPYQGCQTLSPTWSALQKHRKKHPLEFQCTKCSRTFKKRHALQRHKAVHVKVPPARLSCPREDCSETFSTVFNLTHHVRKVHLCLQTHRCYHAGCNRTFCMRESLLRHLVCHDPDQKKLKLKFVMPKKHWRRANSTLPAVEQDLSHLFNKKLLFRFKTLMETNLSSLFNERQLRDPPDPEANLSNLFQLPPNRVKTENAA